jgi:hypothetical protein
MAKRKADAAAEAAEAVAAASAAAEAALLASASVQSGSVGSAGDDVPMPELGTGQPQPQQPAPKRRRMTWMGTYVHEPAQSCGTYLEFARFVFIYLPAHLLCRFRFTCSLSSCLSCTRILG